MKRYDLIEVGYPLTGIIEEVPDGEYVKYGDMLEAIDILFHEFASDYRTDARKRAIEIFNKKQAHKEI